MNQLLKTLCGFIACCWLQTAAQNQRKIDSLKHELTNKIADTLKVIALGELSWEYHIHDKNKALRYAQEELALAEKLSFTKGVGLAYMDKGVTYSYHRAYAEAIENYQKALPYYQKANKPSLIAYVYYNIGIAYSKFEASDKAIDHFLKAIDFFIKQQDWTQVSQTYTGIANSYATLRQFDKAMNCHQKALRVAEEHQDYEMLAVASSDFSNTYSVMFDTYHSTAYLDSSIVYLNRVYELLQTGKVNNPIMLPATLHNLGNAFFQQKKYDQALAYVQKAITLAKQVDLQSAISQGNVIIGKIYTQQGKYALAYNHLQQALPIARQTSPQFAAETYEALYEWAAAQGDYRQALDFQSAFMALKDSLYNIRKAELTEHLALRYETAKKEAKIATLEQENRSQRTINHLYIVLAAMALLLSAVLFGVWRLNRKVFSQKERLLREANENALLKQALAEKQNAQLRKELELQTVVGQLKEEQLRQEIDFKQRELTTNVLLLEKNNEFLQSVKTYLQKILPQANGLKAEFIKVFKLIDSQMANDRDFEKFITHFENVHPDFFNRLRVASPTILTQSELKFCAYIRMNLSTKEIATLLNVEPKSIQMARYRLKQKLNLPEKADLVTFIRQL